MSIRAFAIALAAVAAGCMLPGAASALVFTFTIGGAAAGSGTLTTADLANGDGSYSVTGITGMVQGAAITALLPPGSDGGNDNLLFPNASPQLDLSGLGYATTAEPLNNLFYNGVYGYQLSVDNHPNLSVTFAATPMAGAVAEPASWTMMIAGFGLVGLAMRRRQKLAVSRAGTVVQAA